MAEREGGTIEQASERSGLRPRRKSSVARRVAWALMLCGVGGFAGGAAAQGYVGILGGGPVYKHVPGNIREIKDSKFNELIVWSVEVGPTGDLNLNGEFPLTSAGVYVGNQTYPDFPRDLRNLKQAKTIRITFSVGSSNVGDWQHIKSLVDTQGTGKNSILYRDFMALMAALPVDAIDFDDENSYDAPSMAKFAVMLGKLGYKVTMNPYTNASFWISVVSRINTTRAGTVDGVHLQTFAGGDGNSPCSGWNFGAVPVYPGISDQTSAPPYLTPTQTETAMRGWHDQCGTTGGWVWIFDQIAGTRQVSEYASAITRGVR